MSEKGTKLNLGGFPPIIYISAENKKKREFEKKVKEDIEKSSFDKLNLLNVKNILKESKKNEE